MADEKITLIRGEDGTFYALSYEQLQQFKVPNQPQVDDILKTAKEDCKAFKLSTNVVTRIQPGAASKLPPNRQRHIQIRKNSGDGWVSSRPSISTRILRTNTQSFARRNTPIAKP